MNAVLFLGLLALLFGLTLPIAFRVFPRDGWQFCATLPMRRREDGQWDGLNFTWYGLLSANAYVFAVAMLLILMGSLQVPLGAVLVATVILLAICVPASSWVAQLVEGKAHTFTVGGAVFVGTLLAPWVVAGLNGSGLTPSLPVLPMLSAMAICYAFGEGLGRVGCISFGCCYGKRLQDCRPLTRKVFTRWAFVFRGDTKKIAYADAMEGEQVIPIQAITAMLYLGFGLVGSALFFAHCYTTAFLLTMGLTQAWRMYSETLRADYRGDSKISAYQIMGLLALPYVGWIAWLFPVHWDATPDALMGLSAFWNPGILLFLQALWLTIFIFMGRSAVTGATMDLHIHHDRI